ncbi:hypothetical protein INT48_000131 [Thamnidium elegans]|uniref:Uncharacterized protein n=1 Tax=Thamnidium elegans TaxID=101142 RepID=A0A8H7ST47_9FUNG|nr:hypothetical protein INT48_000131 [Thamnidium elegans]
MSTLTVASMFLISGLYYGLNLTAAYVNRPRFQVHPTWQVRKVYRYKHYDQLIQQHTRTIQMWLVHSGSENLSAFESQRKVPTGEQNFCRSILVQLLEPDQSRDIKDLLHFLREDNKESQNLAEALAYVVLVALEIPMTYAGTLEAFKTVLCKSSDSLLFDFILVSLKNHDTDLAIKASRDLEFDQYTSFLESTAPCMNRLDVLFSKLPVFNYLFASYKIFKETDITPTLFRCFVQRIKIETDRIRAGYAEIPFLAPVDAAVIACNKNNYDPKKFKVTPMNISYTYMRSYKTHYTSLQTQLGQLKYGLDFCKDLQDRKSIASSPLISPQLVKIKQMYLSTFKLYRKEEETLFQFEKAFVVARLCSNDIICVEDMCLQFSEMAFIGRDRFIERHEMDKLNKVVDKNMQLILNLEKAFELSRSGACATFEQLCLSRMDDIRNECREYVVMYNKMRDVWDSLEPIIASIKGCLKLTELESKKESYVIALSGFSIFLYDNNMEILQPFKSWCIVPIQDENDSKYQIITKKIIQGMVEFVSKHLYEIKKDIMSRT